MGYVSASQFEFLSALATALRKNLQKQQLSAELRKAAELLRDNLLGKNRGPQKTRGWVPDAADRRVAQQLDTILRGGLALNRLENGTANISRTRTS